VKNSRTKSVASVAVLTTITASLVAIWIASAGGAASPPALHAFSNPGSAVSATARQQAVLAMTGTQGKLRLLANYGSDAYFQVAGSPRGTCFAIGGPQTLDVIDCDPNFPSEEPVLDVSVVHTDSAGNASFYRVEGWASDGVGSVEVEDATGAAIAEVPVQNNIYSIDPESLPTGAVTIVAKDQSGADIFTKLAST
jgi:hypothetical protein